MSEDDYKSMDGVSDIDEVDFGDVKINPDFYVHNAIMKAQNALANPNMKEGFVQFRLFVEHIETLCRSAGMISEDYKPAIEKFEKEDQKFLEEKDSLIKNTLLANKKMELLLAEIFSNKTSRSPLKV